MKKFLFFPLKFPSKAKRTRKERDKGNIGVLIEVINQIIDRSDRNDAIKEYCDNSKYA